MRQVVRQWHELLLERARGNLAAQSMAAACGSVSAGDVNGLPVLQTLRGLLDHRHHSEHLALAMLKLA
jgi:hypothetical protein